MQTLVVALGRRWLKAQRTWVMDRGIPTEQTLELMRKSDPPISYLVGTPKGKLSSLEGALAKRQWQQARPSVRVKLLAQEGETYILAQSPGAHRDKMP